LLLHDHPLNVRGLLAVVERARRRRELARTNGAASEMDPILILKADLDSALIDIADDRKGLAGLGMAISGGTIGQRVVADLEIRDAHPHALSAAAAVLSRGMRDNPLHISVFGPNLKEREQKLEHFFRIVLAWMSHPPWVAVRQETIVAVCGMGEPGSCQPTFSQKLKIVTQLARTCGVTPTLRALRWLGEWSLRDPKEVHWHLGPLCVDAPLQGLGIGGRLMGEWCKLLDARRLAGYLETDKGVNIEFYEKFGFETIAEAEILGTPNWFMWRDAK
jgi:ribosomal protein S18 acetylase RimI-like enzyme